MVEAVVVAVVVVVTVVVVVLVAVVAVVVVYVVVVVVVCGGVRCDCDGGGGSCDCTLSPASLSGRSLMRTPAGAALCAGACASLSEEKDRGAARGVCVQWVGEISGLWVGGEGGRGLEDQGFGWLGPHLADASLPCRVTNHDVSTLKR